MRRRRSAFFRSAPRWFLGLLPAASLFAGTPGVAGEGPKRVIVRYRSSPAGKSPTVVLCRWKTEVEER
ncbi:MAG TPA: hypothetical protein PKD69_05355, partial [Elusimicrobiota bacterium]|nr:hypothetical protein [Elusimicrobiota bacterium]